ncbi:Domain unknown function DUF295 - like 6 [Theobroma cacao]|nr:Domain unknown function DUF295 - like 6 [Theobroma cacao]
MDEEEQRWDEMESLGDQILFLGMRQAISVSASEFSWGKGNLIFYSTDLCISPRYGHSQERGMLVFDLENGSASPLENCPAYRAFSEILLALRLPVYDHTLSNSAPYAFSNFQSGSSLRPFLFKEEAALPGLPVSGVEEQKVGVAKGEA